MSDIKFGCPHCGQHIACEAAYAGFPVDCPACRGTLMVPTAAAPRIEAGGPTRSAGLYPKPPNLRFWTEAEWDAHVEQLEGAESRPFQERVLAILLVPPLLMIVLMSVVGPSAWIYYVIGLLMLLTACFCAVFTAAKIRANVLVRGLAAGALLAAFVCFYAAVSMFMACCGGPLLGH
jgi:hypothetical protein